MLLNTFWSIILVVYTGSHTHTHIHTHTHKHIHTQKKAYGSHANHSCCCLASQYWDRGIQSSTMTPAPLIKRVRHLLLQIYTRFIPINVTPGWAVTPGSHLCSWVCACLRKQQQHLTRSWTYDLSIRRLMPWPLGYAGSNLHTKHINKSTIHTFA